MLWVCSRQRCEGVVFVVSEHPEDTIVDHLTIDTVHHSDVYH